MSVISPPARDLFPRWRNTSTVPFQLNSINRNYTVVGRSDRIKFVSIDYFLVAPALVKTRHNKIGLGLIVKINLP